MLCNRFRCIEISQFLTFNPFRGLVKEANGEDGCQVGQPSCYHGK